MQNVNEPEELSTEERDVLLVASLEAVVVASLEAVTESETFLVSYFRDGLILVTLWPV